jgi:hypothetical protein
MISMCNFHTMIGGCKSPKSKTFRLTPLHTTPHAKVQDEASLSSHPKITANVTTPYNLHENLLFASDTIGRDHIDVKRNSVRLPERSRSYSSIGYSSTQLTSNQPQNSDTLLPRVSNQHRPTYFRSQRRHVVDVRKPIGTMRFGWFDQRPY